MHGNPTSPTETRETRDMADSPDTPHTTHSTGQAVQADRAGRAGRARRGGRIARSAGLARAARLGAALLGAGLVLASCERTPTKAEYVDDRVAAECAGRSGDAFTLCRLDVIKKYMAVPLEEMQKQFPAPVRKDRLGCG